MFDYPRAEGDASGSLKELEAAAWASGNPIEHVSLPKVRPGDAWVFQSDRIHRGPPVQKSVVYEVLAVFKVFLSHLPPEEVPIIFSVP